MTHKLFWIDMEMTGLDVNTEAIIEVAAVVTDFDLKPLDQYHAVVYQPQTYLDRMDDWNREHHGKSGLTALVPSGLPQEKVEKDLLHLLERHFSAKDRVILAGNSIGQDRLFVNKYLPLFASRLHYRMLDVTSWKILMKDKFKIVYDKKDAHRAVGDIFESIQELATYLSHVKP